MFRRRNVNANNLWIKTVVCSSAYKWAGQQRQERKFRAKSQCQAPAKYKQRGPRKEKIVMIVPLDGVPPSHGSMNCLPAAALTLKVLLPALLTMPFAYRSAAANAPGSVPPLQLPQENPLTQTEQSPPAMVLAALRTRSAVGSARRGTLGHLPDIADLYGNLATRIYRPHECDE